MTAQNLPTVGQAQQAMQKMAQEHYAYELVGHLKQAYNIVPRNQAEVRQYMELGATLEKAEADGLYKSAAAAQEDGNPFLGHVIGRLHGALNTPESPDVQMRKFAIDLVQRDPATLEAALIYAHVMGGGAVAEEPAAA